MKSLFRVIAVVLILFGVIFPFTDLYSSKYLWLVLLALSVGAGTLLFIEEHKKTARNDIETRGINNHVTEAKLQGYNGPFFFGVSRYMQTAQNLTGTTNGHRLESAAKKVAGFIKMERVTTSDEYTWFWALFFEINQHKVAILFPWGFRDKKGDYIDERAIALYTTGASETEMATIVINLQEQMFIQGSKHKILIG